MRKLVLAVLLVSVLIFSITVIDDLGRVVDLDSIPKRVVSAAPSSTRYLVYLGLQDRIVGVTDWDFYKDAERIGNMTPLNVEKIASLNPDLVLLFGGFQASEAEKLDRFGIKSLVLNPTTLDGITRDLVLLGTVMGVREKALKLARDLKNKMLKIAKESYSIPLEKRPKVLYLLGAPESGMKEFWTAVSGSYMNELINLAGGRNIASDVIGPNGWAPISLEFIVERDPDVILVANYVPGSEKEIVEKVESFKPLSGISAVRNGRVYAIDGNLANQPSPQLFDLLEEVHDLLVKGR